MLCFLSCEPEDIIPDPVTGDDGDNAYCQREAGADFICRSSGGGANNRKICVPGDCGVGADCALDDDCGNGLTCVTTLNGGYCGASDCATNADCPDNSLCVEDGLGASYCAKPCDVDADCTFCRGAGDASCRDDAVFLEDMSAQVCVVD